MTASLIKTLQTSERRGAPIDFTTLRRHGISAALAHDYVKSGWLERLGRGVFMFAGDQLDRDATLRFPRRNGQELASVSRHLVVFVLAGTFLTTFMAPAAEKESGIVIYTTLDHGSDETAFAVPFIKAERFALVTNVTTPDGKSVRVTNNQMKELVYPPDLTTATVTDDTGIARHCARNSPGFRRSRNGFREPTSNSRRSLKSWAGPSNCSRRARSLSLVNSCRKTTMWPKRPPSLQRLLISP
jgi:hypothetical protein